MDTDDIVRQLQKYIKDTLKADISEAKLNNISVDIVRQQGFTTGRETFREYFHANKIFDTLSREYENLSFEDVEYITGNLYHAKGECLRRINQEFTNTMSKIELRGMREMIPDIIALRNSITPVVSGTFSYLEKTQEKGAMILVTKLKETIIKKLSLIIDKK